MRISPVNHYGINNVLEDLIWLIKLNSDTMSQSPFLHSKHAVSKLGLLWSVDFYIHVLSRLIFRGEYICFFRLLKNSYDWLILKIRNVYCRILIFEMLVSDGLTKNNLFLLPHSFKWDGNHHWILDIVAFFCEEL